MSNARLLNRAVIRLSPQDPAESVTTFLQGLVTSDMAGPLPVWTGLLTPQGKALFDFIVWADGTGDGDAASPDRLIDCEANVADALVRRLSLYRLRRKITIARDPALGVFWRADGTEGVADPRLPALGMRWIAPIAADDASADDGSADADWRAHRLAQGVPEGQAELGSDQTLWLETNAVELHGVSFTKGCYVGQENTARMNWRQKVNRRLIVVPLSQSDPARQRAAYPDLGLAVDHLRVEAIPDALRPAWLPVTDTPAEA